VSFIHKNRRRRKKKKKKKKKKEKKSGVRVFGILDAYCCLGREGK
jgi:hypothetical protein